MRKRVRILSSLIAVLAWVPFPTSAATFDVTSTADAVDTSPGDGVCRTAAGAGVCSLRAAIQEATHTQGGPHLIRLSAGLHRLSIAGRGEDLCATGDLDVNAGATSIRIVGTGANPTSNVIDGGGIDRVFEVRGGTLRLENLTVQNGRSTGTDSGAGVAVSFNQRPEPGAAWATWASLLTLACLGRRGDGSRRSGSR